VNLVIFAENPVAALHVIEV